MTEPQSHSLISYTDVNESFAESFGETNTDGGDNPHTHISVGHKSTGECGRGGHAILNANGIVIGERVSTGGSKGDRRGDTGERERGATTHASTHGQMTTTDAPVPPVARADLHVQPTF